MMSSFRWCAITSTVIAAAAALAGPANAQVRPRAQLQLSRGAVTPAVRPALTPRVQHTIFGTMGRVGPRRFLFKTRTGRVMLVDDSTAISSGNYSAPLFAGKIVAIDGTFDRNHLFHATSITRFTAIDNQTPPDR